MISFVHNQLKQRKCQPYVDVWLFWWREVSAKNILQLAIITLFLYSTSSLVVTDLKPSISTLKKYINVKLPNTLSILIPPK